MKNMDTEREIIVMEDVESEGVNIIYIVLVEIL